VLLSHFLQQQSYWNTAEALNPADFEELGEVIALVLYQPVAKVDPFRVVVSEQNLKHRKHMRHEVLTVIF